MAHYTRWKDEQDRAFYVTRQNLRDGIKGDGEACGVRNGAMESNDSMLNLYVGKDEHGYVHATWEEITGLVASILGNGEIQVRYFKGRVAPEVDALNVVACNDNDAVAQLLKKWPRGRGKPFTIVDVKSRTERSLDDRPLTELSKRELIAYAKHCEALKEARERRSQMAAEGTLEIVNKPLKLSRF